MPARAEDSPSIVAEVQGLYGAFSFPEKLLQKVWLRGEFAAVGAATIDGSPLTILARGTWNAMGGPDFRGARFRRGGEGAKTIAGDVEVHLHAADWDAHGHARDPAYDDVRLHVVLFPPKPGHRTIGADGQEIPVLVLLPLLLRGLEELAADEAVEGLANRPMARLPEELAAVPVAERERVLRAHAARRWRQKVRFAGVRLEKLGWEAACHHAALEILGYRFNRAPMLRIAAAVPLASWSGGSCDVEALFEAERRHDGWSVQGVRPANHPRVRLRQYSAWVAARPDWPARLAALADQLPAASPEDGTRSARATAQLGAWRERLLDVVAGGVLGGTRWDNVVCDGFLPLWAARGAGRAEGAWFHWYPGDLPDFVRRGLAELGVSDGAARPVCHGLAQGLIGCLLERERGPQAAS
jgi:hypothetical protein